MSPFGACRGGREECEFRPPAAGDAGLETGVPFFGGRASEKARTADPAQKQLAANLWFAVGDFGGKCERGLSPFTKR